MRPLRANYRLINLHMWSYDVQGHPDFSLTAPRLERREGDDALYLTTPGVTLFSKKKGVPDWHGYASYGWVNHTGTLLKLQGQVHLRRAAYDGIPATALDSFDINVWPHQNRLETSAPAQMTQGERQMRGIGLRVNLDHHRLEWLNDSQGSFPPHKP